MPALKRITTNQENINTIAQVIKGKTPIRGGAGNKLIAERLHRVGEMSPSNRSKITLAQVLVIRKGDRVPVAFRGIPGIRVNPAGIAQAAYTDQWCQSNWNNGSDWGSDSWSECWDNSTEIVMDQSILVVNTAKTGVKVFSLTEFSPAEMKSLAGLKIAR